MGSVLTQGMQELSVPPAFLKATVDSLPETGPRCKDPSLPDSTRWNFRFGHVPVQYRVAAENSCFAQVSSTWVLRFPCRPAIVSRPCRPAAQRGLWWERIQTGRGRVHLHRFSRIPNRPVPSVPSARHWLFPCRRWWWPTTRLSRCYLPLWVQAPPEHGADPGNAR